MGTSPQAGGRLALAAPAAYPRNNAASHNHLLNRATFGGTLADRRWLARYGIGAWVDAQLRPPPADYAPDLRLKSLFPLAFRDIRGVRAGQKMYAWDAMFALGQSTLGRQLFTAYQLQEVMIDVFANILHITVPSDNVWDSAPSYLNTVIRRNIRGKFSTMLLAAMRHPAMIRYLDNDQSERRSVNENLGRELLELHTVGVGQFTESDVRNSAYILSGRTVDWQTGEFKYEAWRHWTGPVRVMTFSHANSSATNGMAVGDAYLTYLARHPATARAVATKLARRFVADNPPRTLVDRLVTVYRNTDSAIVPMVRTILSSPEFWASPRGAKTRRPLEDVVGSVRALGIGFGGDPRKGIADLYWQLHHMGHAPLWWEPPNGFPDVTTAWLSASAFVGRWNVHRALVHGWWDHLRPPTQTFNALAPRSWQTCASWLHHVSNVLLGHQLDTATLNHLLAFMRVSANTPATQPGNWVSGNAVALLLDSPAFQLR